MKAKYSLFGDSITITARKYDKLSEEEQNDYVPEGYDKYKRIVVKDYCDECGHLTGTHKEWEPVKGTKIKSYRKLNAIDKLLRKRLMDSITASNDFIKHLGSKRKATT